jgi:photosystem II stability/assembly factor-like uncharacterized protein
MGGTINDGAFINSNTGWLCGIEVIKTTNGGNNWITLQHPEENYIQSIHFIDANTGFSGSFNFWKTTNGGVNWTNMGFGEGNYIDMCFINSLTGWVVSNSNGIWRTTDGGNNWTMINNQYNHTLNAIDFIDANTGWACGYDGAMLKTTNGGSNWTAQNSGVSQDLYTIDFSNATIGRAAGLNGSFTRTTNGGASWSSTAGPFNFFYEKVLFLTPSIGWLSGQRGIALTTNNGTTWIDQTPPDGFANFGSINYISPNTVYIGGFDVYKSTTGGLNFNAPPTLTLTPATTSAINLSWTDVSSDEEKYMIERSTPGNDNWTLIDSVGPNVTTYQNTGLSYNTDYCYRICEKKIIFTGGYSNAPRMRAKLNPPVNQSPSNDAFVTSTTPTLTWADVDGGAFYKYQIAADASFTNIIFTSGTVTGTSQAVPGGVLQNSARYYWRASTQNLISYSDYSGGTSFIVQDPNYGHNMQTANNLYYFANSTAGANLSPSKPVYNWRDTTGSTDIILNGSAKMPIAAGDIDDGRFDLLNKLPAGNSVRFFGTNYQNIYIGTNGIIGFNAFLPNTGGQYQPNSSLPQSNITNAIFLLWKDLNFGDADVTQNRLCYKITNNEIIITYMNAPNYNNTGSDPNDYVSFQVIISHSASPSINSNISMEYNYDQTGSTFITKYNANTLSPYLIGLQGTNSLSQLLQYRYLNTTPQLINSGPMFGSNLALAFGPNVNALPVELQSFTSSVNGNNAKLEWSTVNEQNNSGFDIERKNVNENNWKKINFVQGNGTTNESKNYSYEDKNITSGKYQYRLKQIDFNGNYEYHALANEIEIGVPKKFNLSQNYPNPFNPTTKINFELPRSSNVKLSVYDITGKLASELINEQRAAGYYTVEFNGSNLASGMYFYRIQAGDFSAVKKMVLVK